MIAELASFLNDAAVIEWANGAVGVVALFIILVSLVSFLLLRGR